MPLMLQWLFVMPRYGNGSKKLQSSPFRLVLGPHYCRGLLRIDHLLLKIS